MRHMTNNPMPDSNQEHGIFMVHISYIPSSLDWEATMLTDTTLFLRFSLLSLEFSSGYEDELLSWDHQGLWVNTQ